MNTLANALRAVGSERPIRHATPDESGSLGRRGGGRARIAHQRRLPFAFRNSVRLASSAANRSQAKSGLRILTPMPSFRQQKRVGCYEWTPDISTGSVEWKLPMASPRLGEKTNSAQARIDPARREPLGCVVLINATVERRTSGQRCLTTSLKTLLHWGHSRVFIA
jgi:hypothetical protein